MMSYLHATLHASFIDMNDKSNAETHFIRKPSCDLFKLAVYLCLHIFIPVCNVYFYISYSMIEYVLFFIEITYKLRL